jgi:hypothetical protein
MQKRTKLKHKALSVAFITGAILVIPAVAASAAHSITFPGNTSELYSPNGLYIIKNVDQPLSNGTQWNHNLLFKTKGQKEQIILNPHNRVLSNVPGACSYDRTVDILWSPDSSAFAFNDWIGSNVASAYLYRVHDLSHPIDLGDTVYGAVKGKRDQLAISKSDHIYSFANRWISPTVLEIKETGHASGIAFTFYFRLNLRSKSCKLIRRLPEEDTNRDAAEQGY